MQFKNKYSKILWLEIVTPGDFVPDTYSYFDYVSIIHKEKRCFEELGLL